MMSLLLMDWKFYLISFFSLSSLEVLVRSYKYSKVSLITLLPVCETKDEKFCGVMMVVLYLSNYPIFFVLR